MILPPDTLLRPRGATAAVQEALTNVAEYAQAEEVRVMLQHVGERCRRASAAVRGRRRSRLRPESRRGLRRQTAWKRMPMPGVTHRAPARR